jgi:hypothetical protein
MNKTLFALPALVAAVMCGASPWITAGLLQLKDYGHAVEAVQPTATALRLEQPVARDGR